MFPSTTSANTSTASGNLSKSSLSRRDRRPKFVFSQSEKDILLEAFHIMGGEKTGWINPDRLKIALQATGAEGTRTEIKEYTDKVDKRKTRKITFENFLEIMRFRLIEEYSRDDLKKTFVLFSEEENGEITFEKLKNIANDINAVVNDEELEEMIQEADEGGDGQVGFDDFYKFVKKFNFR